MNRTLPAAGRVTVDWTVVNGSADFVQGNGTVQFEEVDNNLEWSQLYIFFVIINKKQLCHRVSSLRNVLPTFLLQLIFLSLVFSC